EYRSADKLLQVLRTVPERIAEEVDGASLPWRAEHLGDRLLETLVGVRDHQLHASKTAADQAAQELPPERLGLGRPHVQADDLPLAGLVHAVGDHQRSVLDTPHSPPRPPPPPQPGPSPPWRPAIGTDKRPPGAAPGTPAPAHPALGRAATPDPWTRLPGRGPRPAGR